MAGKKGCGGKKGRSGRKSLRIEYKIAQVENLTLSQAIKILQGDDQKQIFALTKDLTGKVLLRRIKVGGESDAPIEINVRILDAEQEKDSEYYLQAPRFATSSLQ